MYSKMAWLDMSDSSLYLTKAVWQCWAGLYRTYKRISDVTWLEHTIKFTTQNIKTIIFFSFIEIFSRWTFFSLCSFHIVNYCPSPIATFVWNSGTFRVDYTNKKCFVTYYENKSDLLKYVNMNGILVSCPSGGQKVFFNMFWNCQNSNLRFRRCLKKRYIFDKLIYEWQDLKC